MFVGVDDGKAWGWKKINATNFMQMFLTFIIWIEMRNGKLRLDDDEKPKLKTTTIFLIKFKS